MCEGPDVFLCILAVLFPPIAVWVKRGICTADSLINIALCMLGYLPGLLHAWYIILAYPDPGYETIENGEAGHGHVVYYYGTVGPSAPNTQFHGQQSGTQNAFSQSAQPQGGLSATKGKKSKAPRNVNASQAAHTSQPSQAPAPADAGPSDAPPPAYEEAVGDHKIQDRD